MEEGQLVEIAGSEEEGFPGSWVCGVLLSWGGSEGLVRYLEFIDDETGQQLEEMIPAARIRPALPQAAARFSSFDQLQAGAAVEMHLDDVWWKGLVLRLTPAGAHIYMPEVDHSCYFVKLLHILRPAYDWVSPGRASQQGHWVLRRLRPEVLRELKIEQPGSQSPSLPAELPHEPVFSELAMLEPPPADAAEQEQLVGEAAAAAAAGAPQLPQVKQEQCEVKQGPELEPEEHQHDIQPFADVSAGGHRSRAAASDQGQQTGRRRGRSSSDAAAGIKQTDGAADLDPARLQAPGQPVQRAVSPVDVSRVAAGAAGVVKKEADGLTGSAADDGGWEDEGRQPKRLKQQQQQVKQQPAETEGAAARRSARAAKPRVVYVDGQPVLKDNLYGAGGEPSVFQKELAAKPYTEQGYPTAPPLSPAAQARRQQLQRMREHRLQHNQQREERCLSPAKARAAGRGGAALGARRKHNADVKAMAQLSGPGRLSGFTPQRPFIAPQVADSIERAAAAAPPGALKNLPEPPSGQPEQIKAVLRGYQLEGVSWLLQQHQRSLNCILADEMGLGKTLQTIAFFAALKWGLGVAGPHLVVVPLSVMSSWMAELARWCPELRAVKLHTADLDERRRLRQEVLSRPDSFDVAVTTYEMVASPDFGRPIQSMLRWRYLVLDEGHRIRNGATLTNKALRLVQRGHTLLLTGTPLQNNMVELYGLLSFMYPDVFTTPGPFEAAFNLTKGQVDQAALSAAHYLLRPFCLRRLKSEVEVSLPPKVETRITVPLSEMQTFWYRRLLLRNHEALSALEAAVTRDSGAATAAVEACSGGNAWKRLMNLIMQLRKVVDHPFIMPDSEPGGEGSSSLDQLLEASGKLSVLHRLLAKLKARGHRLVLFSQFTMMLDILEDYLDQAGHSYVRLDGSMNRVQRMINISQFNKPNSDLFIFLASTRAGGLGLNLQSADTVILYDSDWNPQWDLQAMARVHRIGQTRPVHIYRLVTGSSVEERMLQRADSKLYLDQMVNRGSTAKAQELDSLGTRELLAMLTFGADRILSSQTGQPPSDADLDALLDRSREAATMAVAQDDALNGKQGAAAGGGTAPPAAPSSAANSSKVAAAEGGSSAGGSKGAAEAAGSSNAAAQLMPLQFNAATFQADAPPPSTFTLNGIDYSAAGLARLRQEAAAEAAAAAQQQQQEGQQPLPLAVRKLQSSLAGSGRSSSGGGAAESEEGIKATLAAISREWRAAQAAAAAGADAQRAQRQRQARLLEVDGYQVLRVNDYDWQKGGISAWQETRAGVRPENGGQPPKRRLQKAGRDYCHADTCQVCWDGGELLCCDVCPAAYHAECLGQDAEHLAARQHWACPHHTCASCGRGPAAAGGLLFRCGVCESAWCEDHLPAEHEILGEWPLFQALGQDQPANACFILCGPDCQSLQQRLQPTIDAAIKNYNQQPELRLRERQAEADNQAAAAARKAGKKSKGKRSRLLVK